MFKMLPIFLVVGIVGCGVAIFFLREKTKISGSLGTVELPVDSSHLKDQLK